MAQIHIYGSSLLSATINPGNNLNSNQRTLKGGKRKADCLRTQEWRNNVEAGSLKNPHPTAQGDPGSASPDTQSRIESYPGRLISLLD